MRANSSNQRHTDRRRTPPCLLRTLALLLLSGAMMLALVAPLHAQQGGTIPSVILDPDDVSLPDYIDVRSVTVSAVGSDALRVTFQTRGPILPAGDPRTADLHYRVHVDVDEPFLMGVNFDDPDFVWDVVANTYQVVGPGVLPNAEVDGNTVALTVSLDALAGVEQVAFFIDTIDFATSPLQFDQTDAVTITLSDITTPPVPSPDDEPPSGSGLVYIANRGAAAVTVIDAETQTIVETIAVSDQPLDQDLRWVEVRPDGGAVYVTGDAQVFVIDPASGTVTTTIPTTGPNRDLAIHPNSSLVYVADANVAVIETSGHTVIDTITIAGTPYGVTLTPNATQLYVTTLEGTVEVIDVTTRASVASIAVGGSPKMVAFTPDGQRAYVTDTSNDVGQVTVLNTSTQTIVTTIAVGGAPYGVAITPDGSQAYVAEGANGIAIITTGSQTITGTIPVMAVDVAITPDGTQAIATQWQTGEVMLIDTATLQVTATLGAVGAWGIGITPEDMPVVTLVDGVDLVVNITKVKRKVKDAGDKVTVKVEVCNNGSDPAEGPFDVGIFIAEDQNLSAAATPLQTFSLNSLASGECQRTVKKERKFNVTGLPVTLGLVVVVKVDVEDQVSESDETNNQASQPIAADLVVSITKVKRKVKDAGNQLVVKIEVCNNGSAPAQSPFDVAMFLSDDGSVNAAATPLQTFSLDTLAAGKCQQTIKKERRFKVIGLPETLGQVVVVAVDSDNQVSESDESNNQASQAIEEAP